jgi:hypothetical protein
LNYIGDPGERWQNKCIHHFDSMNKKFQVTQEKIYSEARKKEKDLEITKVLAGQKSTEKLRQQKKSSRQFQALSLAPSEGEAKPNM